MITCLFCCTIREDIKGRMNISQLTQIRRKNTVKVLDAGTNRHS